MERDAPSSLIAAKRREKRRQRILEESERRMQTILSGTDGNESRSPPAIEGGSGYKSAVPSSPPNNNAETTEDVGNAAPQLARSPTLEELGISYNPEPWYSFIKEHRFHVAFLIGILFRISVAISLLTNVAVPWLIGNSVFHFATLRMDDYPVRGLILNALLYFGMDDYIVCRLGYFSKVVCEFSQDSLTAICGFLLTHLLLHFFKTVSSQLCSL